MTASSSTDELFQRRPELAACRADMQRALDVLKQCFRAGHKLLLCGNGGSAADCEHFSGELLNKFKIKRPLDAALRKQLSPELANALQGGLPAIPLTGFISAWTAIANDIAPQMIFAQLVSALGQSGDVLFGISTSGNAANVIAAFEIARAKGMKTIALTGRGGGKLAALADVAIKAPADVTAEVQELHLPIYHYLCEALEAEFFG